MEITIVIKNDKKAKKILEFLNDIPYIEIKEKSKKSICENNVQDFKKLFGLWKEKDISLESIRKKAWKRTT